MTDDMSNPTDKKIQNNVCNYNVEGAEVDKAGGEIPTVRFPIVGSRCTVGRLNHTVMHDFVPVLAGYDTEQHCHSSHWCAEICSARIVQIHTYNRERNTDQRKKHRFRNSYQDEYSNCSQHRTIYV